MISRQRSVYFALFAASGFSGLIYESIWTHYLKLFLGHAAYAQTLVLAIFMGGMALGSWLCSRYSARWANLLAGYAAAEAAIGFFALLFHTAFTHTIELSYAAVIPRLGSPALVSAYKWGLATLMILPQSVLLGMTFPLMSGGILRLFPDRPGRSIGFLYFTNSIGAVFGVLASSFVLIRWGGLPGTVRTAGAVNLVLAATVWALARGAKAPPEPSEAPNSPTGEEAASNPGRYRFFLLVSLVTGASSFLYEIGWIRMLSLVLGTSTHAFELMLAAFILGLALGGLWIQRRIDRVGSPARTLGKVQVWMGVLALATLPLYGGTFEVVRWLVRNLAKTDAGYALFNLASGAVAVAVMLPATFCAGMTLPLVTYSLLRQGHGEKSIGAVYAANTVGAIAGVFAAVHLVLPAVGLKGLIVGGAALDVALGLALLWTLPDARRAWRPAASATAAGAAAVLATALFVQLDPYKMGSGVYRQGTFATPAEHRLLFHRDGKTATVTCFQNRRGTTSLRTNGKTDASVMMTPGLEPVNDEYTMVLLGALPLALHPSASTAAVVGFGSGMTTHTLLCNPRLRRVDTVEIEEAMVSAASFFRPAVERAYTDPRGAVHVDDAKTFFSTRGRTYDLIVSEPSNPWVSGVASLFSEEFYRLIRRHLNAGGIFAQWIQLYEIDLDLVASILKALAANFPDYAVYATNRGDVLVAAARDDAVRDVDDGVLAEPALAALLRRIHVEGPQDLRLRKIGTKRSWSGLLRTFPLPANSDYFPVLDQNAGRARFLGKSAQEVLSFSYLPLPTFEMLGWEPPPPPETRATYTRELARAEETAAALSLRDYFAGRRGDLSLVQEYLKERAVVLRSLCGGQLEASAEERIDLLFNLSLATSPYLSAAELASFWRLADSGACARPASALEGDWRALLRAVGERDAGAMRASARRLLETGGGASPLASHYLLASGMLGALAQGQPDEAARLWSTYGKTVFGAGEPDLLFRLLVAEAGVSGGGKAR